MSLFDLVIWNQKYKKAISHELAVKVLLGTVVFKIYLLFRLTVKNFCVHLRKQSPIGLHLNNCFESFTKTLKIPVRKFFFRKLFLKLNSLTGTFKDFCYNWKKSYLAECLIKAVTAFIWLAFKDQGFFILQKPTSKFRQCIDLLKWIIDANYDIHQSTFRVSSVLH